MNEHVPTKVAEDALKEIVMSQKHSSKSVAPLFDAGAARSQTKPLLAASHFQFAGLGIDESGSMVGRKIDDVQAAVLVCVAELANPVNRDAFEVGVVTYGSTAGVLLEPKKATQITPADLELQAGRRGPLTNMGDGLMAAKAMVERMSQRPGAWRKPMFLMFTDGHSNEGRDAVAAAAELKTVADVIAVGYGDDADFDLLRKVATKPELAIKCADGAELRRFFSIVGKTTSLAASTGQSVVALLGPSLLLGQGK